MRTQVKYEWTLETLDEHGDIIDSDFTRGDKITFDKKDIPGKDFGLIRNEGNEAEGLTERYWAYVKDGKLPEYFSDANGGTVGYKVPAKYHAELLNYLK